MSIFLMLELAIGGVASARWMSEKCWICATPVFLTSLASSFRYTLALVKWYAFVFSNDQKLTVLCSLVIPSRGKPRFKPSSNTHALQSSLDDI
jgi:hypothetical protein